MTNDLTKGPIGIWLAKLTAPMVLGIFAIFLFNLVDTYFISLLGTAPLAAVSFTFPITMLVMNLAIGLSISTGAVVAKAVGSQNKQHAQYWISTSIFLACLLGVIVGGVGYYLQPWIFDLLGASIDLLPLIHEYMDIWLLGCVGLVVLIVINASVRATGNTKLPSLVMLLSALINGILDPILIFGVGPIPSLGIQGAAIATLVSWLVAIVWVCRSLVSKELLTFRYQGSTLRAWNRLLSLGLPAALTNMLGPISNAILVSWVAVHGTEAVAAYGVGSRLEPIALIVVMAFTASLPPFVGQNFGAGNTHRIEHALLTSMKFLVGWQLLVYALLALFAQPISSLFSDEPEVQSIIRSFLYIMPLSYIGIAMSLVATATINALHKTKVSLNINILRLFILYIPCAWIGDHFFGLIGIFWGCAIANVIIGVIIVLLFKKVRSSEAWQAKLITSS